MKVGLIGLGLMGEPMGFNWIKKGFGLSILPHRRTEAAAALEKSGAQMASSVEDLCKKSDVIILMVPTSREVESLTHEIEKFITPQQFVIDMSTSEPASTLALHKSFKENGLRFFDAPVTGGVKGATEGTLTLFIGGPEEWVKACMPVLGAVSQKQIHFGDAGQGHVAKIINNFVCIGNMAVLAEALPMASKLGLDPNKIFDALSDGMAASRQLNFYGPQILQGDFAPRFRLSHALKDMKMAKEITKQLKVTLPVLEGIISDFDKATILDLLEKNVSALIQPIEKAMGTEFRSAKD